MGLLTREPARPLQRTSTASAAQCLLESDAGHTPLPHQKLGWLFMRAEKASHLRCVPDEVIGFISELHFGQHVAGEELALGSVFLSVANFYELLRGNDDFFEKVIQMSMLRLLSDGIGDLALEIREGLNDVPAFRHERRARGA